MSLREKSPFVLKKSAGFAENDVRVPPTNLVCAFLKYGKLEAAEPCGATDQCSLIQPAIQFSKNFLFDDIEWMDEFLDPGVATTIEKMDNISERVNTYLLSGSSQPLIILSEAAKNKLTLPIPFSSTKFCCKVIQWLELGPTVSSLKHYVL